MLQIFWDTRGYFFWLLMISLFVALLERVRPWRREQKVLRRQWGQDLFWLIFNGHYAGVLIAMASGYLLNQWFPQLRQFEDWQALKGTPAWVQFLAFFVIKDFVEWGIHNTLHRVPWLWNFHKVHHSVEELDWIGNFRFHWMEIVIYKSLSYLPLVILGVEGNLLLWIALFATLVGHLNHSNLNLTYGPLKYVFNSPRMHVWHHMYDLPEGRKSGVNFGIVLSVWDWIFKTAYWPNDSDNVSQQPERLGFEGIDQFPRGLLARLLYPLSGPFVRNRRNEVHPPP